MLVAQSAPSVLARGEQASGGGRAPLDTATEAEVFESSPRHNVFPSGLLGCSLSSPDLPEGDVISGELAKVLGKGLVAG